MCEGVLHGQRFAWVLRHTGVPNPALLWHKERASKKGLAHTLYVPGSKLVQASQAQSGWAPFPSFNGLTNGDRDVH